MPIDHIAFPLPVVVKGYACLSGAEIELAEKDIDPAHPPSVGQATTGEPPVARNPAAQTPDSPPPARSGEEAARVISYGPGIVRRAETAKATTYSITA